MRKVECFLMAVLMVMFFISPSFSQRKSEKDKVKIKRTFDKITKAYAYMDEELLISDADLYCSYFISNKMPEDLVIVGSEYMDSLQTLYTDGNKMFINKGSNVGINEGDIFLVLSRGEKISNALTSKKLGTYYLKKSLAEVTCLYEDKAVVTLKKGCYPVEIGDFLIPFKKQQTVFKKKLNYKKCKLPQSSSAIEGNVVYTNIYMDVTKTIASTGEYVSIDLGKAIVSKGTFVLFYKLFKKNLPPLIIGSGIVVNPQNTNSTVKVLDASQPIGVGVKLVVLPEAEAQIIPTGVKDEDIPVIESLKKEEREIEPGEDSMEVNILFNIDEKSIDSGYAEIFDKVKEFIHSKTRYNIILRGYACSIGGLEYNLKLSKERVDAVKAYLVRELGVDENLIESYYYGEKDAPYDNTTEEQRRKNRMVNIQVIGK
jgi:outer membrane protein OmpA-like peptidoglycan-associated protein